MARRMLCAGLAALLCLGGASARAPRPNIVWVMADDLGWGEPGLFPSTSPHGRIATPSLDRFGREGMVFTHAYAGYTVCAPSRTTFFTGRHSGNFVKHGFDGQALRPNQTNTLAMVLKQAGYNTGAFGKVAPLTSPTLQGFDAFVGQIDQALCHNMYPRAIDTGLGQLNFNLTGNWRPRSRKLCMANPAVYNFTTDVFHAAAMEWLQGAARRPEPFFLYLSFTVPHAGGWGDAPQSPEQGNPVPSDLHYASKGWPDVEKDHAATTTYMDSKVGELMTQLAALGVDNSTVVFFASDNGAHLEGGHSHQFFNSTGGLQGHKRSLFEGGVRSPTMARWPGTIPAGATSEFAWAFWDAMPTLAELAGADAPPGLDGVSIVPTLRGLPQPAHSYLYFTWEGQEQDAWDGGAGCRRQKPPAHGYSVRVRDWKGIVRRCPPDTLSPGADDVMELFNLTADPFEFTDLAASHPDVVKELKSVVLAQNLTCHCFQCGIGSCSEIFV